MSGPFHSLSIANSGMDVYQTWLDAVADNIANVSTIASTDEAAFQERFIVAKARQDGGAKVDRVEFGNPLGRIVYDPAHPLADEEGFIRTPDMNLSDQMTHMIVAQRAYQANVSAFKAARSAYETALTIGR